MNILDIKVTQRKLKRFEQIKELVKTIKEGSTEIERIEICQEVSGDLVCLNGHHRLAAYYLAGRKTLNNYEYDLLYCEAFKPTFGNIENLIKSARIV